jgi:hypothetical protein
LVGDGGCSEECDSPGGLTGGGEEDAILAADAAIESDDEGLLGRSDAAGYNRVLIIALFVLWTLGLLLGIAGGLRAFRDRDRYGFP